jgi:hypothetical protein
MPKKKEGDDIVIMSVRLSAELYRFIETECSEKSKQRLSRASKTKYISEILDEHMYNVIESRKRNGQLSNQ